MANPVLPPLFNPKMQVVATPLSNGQHCYVVDDVLLESERMVAWAAAQQAAFQPVGFSAYPGQFLLLPAELNAALESFFLAYMRPLFDARRLVRSHTRLSMVTLSPQALRPAQWLCHSDHFGLEPSQSIQASVLYLFKNEGLGGTGFYEPARPAEEMKALFDDAIKLSAADFATRYGLEPGYLQGSNPFFNRIGGVPARWNRMVFYDGTILHTSDIPSPQLLGGDPKRGRLTLNGFYTCRRNAV